MANSQKKESGDSITVTGTEYVPVEVRKEAPPELEGAWTLTSGLKARPTNIQEKFEAKKVPPGTEIKTAEAIAYKEKAASKASDVEIKMVAPPPSDYTPPQGDEVHMPESPSISFFGLNETVTGYTGCNKFTGRYSLKDKKISLNTVAPSTQLPCLGRYDEKEFLNKLKKVNTYKTSNGQLQLMHNDEVLLTFSKM